jgi:hypothetical protein
MFIYVISQQISMVISISSNCVFSNHLEKKNCNSTFGSNVLIWQQLLAQQHLGCAVMSFGNNIFSVNISRPLVATSFG